MYPSSASRQLSERIENLYLQALCDNTANDELIDPRDGDVTPWPLFLTDIGDGPQTVRIQEWGNGVVELQMEHAEGLPLEFPVRIGVFYVTDTLRLLGDDGRVMVLSHNALHDENPEVPEILARYVLQHLFSVESPPEGIEPRIFVVEPRSS